MKVLIILAHPSEESHNYQLFTRTHQHALKKTKEVTVIKLYQEYFDPVLRYPLKPEQERQKNKYQQLLKNSTHIIIHYPIWWNNAPAILKGFFDVILERGYAYKFHPTIIPKIGIPEKLLSGRAITITTSGGVLPAFKIYQRARGDKVIRKDCLEMCGITTRNYHLGGATNIDEDNERMDNIARKATQWLFKK